MPWLLSDSCCFSEEMVSVLLLNSTLKSSRFIPGAATSIRKSSLVSRMFTAGKVTPENLRLWLGQFSKSLVQKSSNIVGIDHEEPFFFVRLVISNSSFRIFWLNMHWFQRTDCFQLDAIISWVAKNMPRRHVHKFDSLNWR